MRQKHVRVQRWQEVAAWLDDHAGLVAFGLLALFVACSAAIAALGSANSSLTAGDLSLWLAFTTYMIVGALIIAHRSGNAVGWIFSGIGLLAVGGVLAQEYAAYGFVTRPGSLPLATFAAWFATWFWFPLIASLLVFSILFFPTGRLLSRRWRPITWTAGLGTATMSVLASLNPTIKLQDHDFTLANPIGVEWIGDVEETLAGGILFVVLLSTMLGSFASLALRFHRARGDERQQLKLFTFAGVLVIVLVLGEEVVWRFELGDLFFGSVVALVPVSAGVAILRYRLYDIDRIISRTLTYGVLTAMLAGGYLLAVLALQSLLPVSDDSPLIVAASTLGVVAAFGPLRTRVQRAVDHRFNRVRYDAALTVESFGSRLRNTVDIESVGASLVSAVVASMAPSHVSLWLRNGETR